MVRERASSSCAGSLQSIPPHRAFRSRSRATRQADRANCKRSAADRAWAFGTLAELDLLGTVYSKGEDADPLRIRQRVIDTCGQIRNLTGGDSFHVSSTRRQFQRYLEWWDRAEWREVARAAVSALSS